jgi:hypothetical protein
MCVDRIFFIALGGNWVHLLEIKAWLFDKRPHKFSLRSINARSCYIAEADVQQNIDVLTLKYANLFPTGIYES